MKGLKLVLAIVLFVVISNVKLTYLEAEEANHMIHRVVYTQKHYNKTFSKKITKKVKYTGSSKYVTITANWKIKVSFLYTVNPNNGKIGNYQTPTVSLVSPYISDDLGVASLNIEDITLNKNANKTALNLYVAYNISASPLAYPRSGQVITFGTYSITDNSIS